MIIKEAMGNMKVNFESDVLICVIENGKPDHLLKYGIGFAQGEKGKIGRYDDRFANKKVSETPTYLQLWFEKTASIDVLIDQLEELKKVLKN